ncbi:hypothetical protein QSJ19_17610 [Gordonia sp. ABSL11-1]|uniref:hypothetical protein n=1 Tax=Gordonia sp. ABSL11-1 TaxID=3053924 RepID=UPI0025726665|nr:hypothetical protein [Gordonia sp. ABSL11-1]MDL9947363.1 hypothetical protein [Gordonia sp. ABSL11-1]
MTRVSDGAITAEIGRRIVGRAEVLSWENRRIDAAARRLHVSTLGDSSVADRRDELVRRKLELGPDEISARLQRDLRLSGPIAAIQARVSGRRRISRVDLMAPGAGANDFVDWFRSATAESDQRTMLRACPDHFIIRSRPDGRQEVLETTGGSPFAALFMVDYSDISGLVTLPDREFEHQIAGVALDSGSRAIGGVRHQFRDTEDGMHARLTVEFPFPTLSNMISAHRWHLACEFSNWIVDAFT